MWELTQQHNGPQWGHQEGSEVIKNCRDRTWGIHVLQVYLWKTSYWPKVTKLCGKFVPFVFSINWQNFITLYLIFPEILKFQQPTENYLDLPVRPCVINHPAFELWFYSFHSSWAIRQFSTGGGMFTYLLSYLLPAFSVMWHKAAHRNEYTSGIMSNICTVGATIIRTPGVCPCKQVMQNWVSCKI